MINTCFTNLPVLEVKIASLVPCSRFNADVVEVRRGWRTRNTWIDMPQCETPHHPGVMTM
jgi:hypothetical protein